MPDVILAALRDLQWRRKRFAIAIVATALVFSMGLIMSGLSDSFPNEVDTLLDTLGGESYLAEAGQAGPFTSVGIVPVAKAPDAAPMLFWSAALKINGKIQQVSLLGLPSGWPLPVDEGRAAKAAGEIVADRSSGLRVGDTLDFGTASYRVAGTTDGVTLFGGQAVVFLTIGDAQQQLAGGAPITRAFIERDADGPPPDGLARYTNADTAEDLLRPIKSASQSIAFVRFLLWIVAACIIGSVVFLSALERTRDFAIFKATGVKGWQMGAGLALQAVVLAVGASILAIAVALLLAPAFPMPVTIPAGAAATLPLIGIAIGLVASLAGLRRTVTADPAQAFGG